MDWLAPVHVHNLLNVSIYRHTLKPLFISQQRNTFIALWVTLTPTVIVGVKCIDLNVIRVTQL